MATMLELGIPALRTISISFLLAGYCIVVGSVFQALGHGLSSMSVSMARQLLVLLPAAFILSRTIGLAAVWWAFPIAELASVTVSTLLFIRIWKKEIKGMQKSAGKLALFCCFWGRYGLRNKINKEKIEKSAIFLQIDGAMLERICYN